MKNSTTLLTIATSLFILLAGETQSWAGNTCSSSRKGDSCQRPVDDKPVDDKKELIDSIVETKAKYFRMKSKMQTQEAGSGSDIDTIGMPELTVMMEELERQMAILNRFGNQIFKDENVDNNEIIDVAGVIKAWGDTASKILEKRLLDQVQIDSSDPVNLKKLKLALLEAENLWGDRTVCLEGLDQHLSPLGKRAREGTKAALSIAAVFRAIKDPDLYFQAISQHTRQAHVNTRQWVALKTANEILEQVSENITKVYLEIKAKRESLKTHL